MNQVQIQEHIRDNPGVDLVDLHIFSKIDIEKLCEIVQDLEDNKIVERRSSGIRFGYYVNI